MNQSTSPIVAHNIQLSESQTEIDAIVLRLKELGLDQAHPDYEKYFGDFISLLQALGLDQFKPGEELSFGDITTFLQTEPEVDEMSFGDLTPFLPTEPVEEMSSRDSTPFLPSNLHHHQSPEFSKLELELILLELETDPVFAKILKAIYCRSNIEGEHPFIAPRIAWNSAGRHYYRYILTIKNLATARQFHAYCVAVRNSWAEYKSAA